MPRFLPQHLYCADGDAQSMRDKAYLLSEEWFHSVPLQPGDMLVFKQSVPHFGVRNQSIQPRMMLFTMLVPEEKEEEEKAEEEDEDADMQEDEVKELESDEYQFFRWMYMSEAYGEKSLEFAQSLVHDKHNNPLGRYPSKLYKQSVACLKQHQLYAAYFGDEGEPDWEST